MKAITFIVTEDEFDGGYVARAHVAEGNRDLFTQGDARDELLHNIREAIDAAFDDAEPKPDVVHVCFV